MREGYWVREIYEQKRPGKMLKKRKQCGWSALSSEVGRKQTSKSGGELKVLHLWQLGDEEMG